MIYIRHGEPTTRASYAAPNLEPNESWRYSRPEGDLIFHFVAREDVQDFKLVESLFDVLGFSNAIALRENRTSVNPVAEQLMLSREPLSPIYQRLEFGGRCRRRALSDGGARDRAGQHRGRDQDRQLRADRSRRSSRSVREVLAVGHDSAGSMVQIAYAIAGSSLEPVTVTRGYLYSVRVRFVATDRNGESGCVARYHSALRCAGPGPRGRASGGPRRRARCRRGSTTTGWRSSRARSRASCCHEIRSGSASRLRRRSRSATSCWAAARRICSGAAPATTPSPSIRSDTFKRNQDMDLYYEVEGLHGGNALHGSSRGAEAGWQWRAVQEDLRRRRRRPCHSSSTEQGAFPVGSSHRSLKLETLKPGNYTLEVVVDDGQGRTDRRSQPFQVVEE